MRGRGAGRAWRPFRVFRGSLNAARIPPAGQPFVCFVFFVVPESQGAAEKAVNQPGPGVGGAENPALRRRDHGEGSAGAAIPL